MPETTFFWDPLSDNVLHEQDDTGTVTAEYTSEPGLYGNLIGQNRGGVESQYHFDALGSTLALSDGNQQVTDDYGYSAFGEVIEHSGSTSNPFQFIGSRGYRRDFTVDQYYVRRRVLVPHRGRWMSKDRSRGVRTYHYANNAPAVRTDPSGRWPFDIFWPYTRGCYRYICKVDSFRLKLIGTVVDLTFEDSAGRKGKVVAPFEVDATFSDRVQFLTGDITRCTCCEYRQYAYAWFIVEFSDGDWDTFSPIGHFEDPFDVYEEDCANGRCFGHRTNDPVSDPSFADEYPTPCSYHMRDEPGIYGIAELAREAERRGLTFVERGFFQFWIEIHDVCQSRTVVSKEFGFKFTVKWDGTQLATDIDPT